MEKLEPAKSNTSAPQLFEALLSSNNRHESYRRKHKDQGFRLTDYMR